MILGGGPFFEQGTLVGLIQRDSPVSGRWCSRSEEGRSRRRILPASTPPGYLGHENPPPREDHCRALGRGTSHVKKGPPHFLGQPQGPRQRVTEGSFSHMPDTPVGCQATGVPCSSENASCSRDSCQSCRILVSTYSPVLGCSISLTRRSCPTREARGAHASDTRFGTLFMCFHSETAHCATAPCTPNRLVRGHIRA